MKSLTNAFAAVLLLVSLSLVSGCKDSSIPNIKEPELIKDTAKVILSGVMVNERDPVNSLIFQPLLKMDTGDKFVLFNPAYVNTLGEQIGKHVKIRGSLCGTTSFRGYKGIMIDDILEVQQ